MSKHVHRYERFKKKNRRGEEYIVWKCTLTGCNHFIINVKELVVGRETICHRCGDTTVMTKELVDYKKPHCPKCTKHRKPQEEVKAEQDAIETLLKDLGMT